MTTNYHEIAIPATTYLNKAYLWHLRLGHIHQNRLKQIQTMSKGIEPFDENETTLCQSYTEGKQHKENFPNQTTLRAIEFWK